MNSACAIPVAFAPLRSALGCTVDQLESQMVQYAPVSIDPVHHFADGLYAREITIPAGTLLTGKVHRTRHLNIVSAGDISVWTERDGLKRIVAPCTFVSEPGTRRVGYAHTETVWTTLHPTTETNLDQLEVDLITPHVNPLLDVPLEVLACRG